MSTTVTVYDHNNTPHHMSPANARDMIQHNKWSTTPVDRKALAAAQAQREKAVSEAADNGVDTRAVEQELNGKSKAEMVAFALDRYGEKLDGRKSEADLINAIIELAKIAGSAPSPDDVDDEGNEGDGAGDGAGEGGEGSGDGAGEDGNGAAGDDD
ncbi:MAG: hypothetical protein RIA09_15755 [Hoeflea sp.]|jgi:hypothetical protein|uniref:hypothetical protein n=1 Tax=Hoeflea sp. TaxID=1940281 RepID=UPI0032EC5924